MSDRVVELTARELRARIQGFLREHLADRSAATVATYRRSLNRLLAYTASEGDRFAFSREGVGAFMDYLKGSGVSQATLSTYASALRQFGDYLIDIGVLETNPARLIKVKMQPRTHRRDVLTEEEVERLASVFREDSALELRDRALACCMLYAGLSEIELVRADAGDLDHTLLGWVLRVQGKGRRSKDERVPLDEPAIEPVQAYLAARDDVRAGGPLFVSHGPRSAGQRLNTRSVRTRINELLRRAGIERDGVSPHSLTHTAPLLWLDRGMTLEEVRQRMRHGTLDTTRLYLDRHRQR